MPVSAEVGEEDGLLGPLPVDPAVAGRPIGDLERGGPTSPTMPSRSRRGRDVHRPATWDGTEPYERQPSADRPEPEQALKGSAAQPPDHDVADADDRRVEFDDPEAGEPSFDDDDRDPGAAGETFPGAPG
jgi:hypothetical protein